MIELTLPFPPSVNRMWRTPHKGKLAGRTLLSEDGRMYRENCLAAILEQKIPQRELAGSLFVSVKAFPPDKRRRDLDNMLKGILDALNYCKVIKDDSHIDKLEISRGPSSEKGEVWLSIGYWKGQVAA